MHRYALAALLGALLISSPPAAQAAGAPALAAPGAGDPWERTNRKAYAFEDELDRHIIRPVAHFYRWLTPGPIGRGLHNVFVNLSEPVALINDVLQLRFKRAEIPAVRFVTNSTIGLFGLFDVAGRFGLDHHDNEFGVTLGRYRLVSGPYLYVPLVGPTTVRDLLGSGVDFLADPVRWVRYNRRGDVSESRLVVGGLDKRVTAEPQLNSLLSGAVDPYATLRSAFLQNKQGEIEGGGVPLDLPSFDEPDAVPAPLPMPDEGSTPATAPPPAAPAPPAPPVPPGPPGPPGARP